jgi:hypothetical protein
MQWLLKWSSNPSIFKWNYVIFSRILFSVEKNNFWKIFGKSRSSPTFKISPLKWCHYLEAPVFVKLRIPQRI